MIATQSALPPVLVRPRRLPLQAILASAVLIGAAATGATGWSGQAAPRDAALPDVVTGLETEALVSDFRTGFAMRDLNHDGVLTRDELPYLSDASFRRLDANGDGRITMAEAAPPPAVIQAAAKQAERGLRQAFAAFDRNGDGRITSGEAPLLFAALGTNPNVPLGFEAFGRALQRAPSAPPLIGSASKYPVLMLPGFLMPSNSFVVLQNALAQDGYTEFKVLDRWPWFSDIREFATEGKFFADRMRKENGAAKVELVAHSMGGLVGRYMIEDLGYEPYVDHYVSFGTPHHGTLLGPLLNWSVESVKEMTPGSAFLKALNAQEGRPSPIKYTSVHAAWDEIVLPHESVTLRGADNPEIPNALHIEVIFTPDAGTMLRRAFAR